MKLYNSLSKSIEPFYPQGDSVSIYVCGITPYDTTHLGHAFTYTSADILIRYLEYNGLAVRYVQNVTDIDDDILRKAKESGEDWQNLAGHGRVSLPARDRPSLPEGRGKRLLHVRREIYPRREKRAVAEMAR